MTTAIQTDTQETKPVVAAALKVKTAKAKKIASSAAVIPMVNAKTKQVFLKIVKANADKSKEAAMKAIDNKDISYFDGEAKAFVKEHGIENITIWKSRIAQVQPLRVAKSALNQIDFWARNGYTVTNKADFTVPAEATVNTDAGVDTTVAAAA